MKRCYVCGKTYYTKYKQNIVCKQCFNLLKDELGDEWYKQDWWRELVRLNVAERRNDEREDACSLEFVDETQIRPDYGTVYNIILRLYKTYGYGSRMITNILTNTYRIKLTRRSVGNILRKIKEAGVPVDNDAEFWRRWHAYLRSVGFIKYE